MSKKTSETIFYCLLILLIIVFGVSAQVLMNKNKEKEVIAKLEYNEESSINYQVYYMENPYYLEPYIDEGKTYIDAYINKIVANFNYNVNYNGNINNSSYEHYIKASLIAYSPESEPIWRKEYKLTDPEKVNLSSTDKHQINREIEIDYQTYKNDLSEFTNAAKVNANARLVIEMIVNNEGEYPGLDNFDHTANLKMEVPLTDATFKINTSSTVNDDTHKIVKYNEDESDEIYKSIIIVLMWTISLFALVVLVIVYYNNHRNLSYYERTLRKILTTYDSIIVNVEHLPNLDDIKPVEVTDFEELLDAQNEVRCPINFKEDKKKRRAKFVLVYNNLAWVYTLKNDD